MLDIVKENLSGTKDKLVPVSFRIEGSTKLLIEHMAHQYGVKQNELVREILKAFIDEAAGDFKVKHELGDLTWCTKNCFDETDESPFGFYTDHVRSAFSNGSYSLTDEDK
ncbi:MAG: hypothetical protein WBG65_14180 [Sulfurimonadaceae bacterium]